MAVNIGPRIGIDGEREYRKQINDLITQQKTFSAEMKEVESAFDDSTSAMEKNRKKGDLLKKAIANQEKAVEELEKGLEASRKKFGENSTQTQKWKQAVANAKTELNKLNHELDELPNGLQNAGKKMQSVGKKMKSVGEGFTKYVSAPLGALAAASIAAFNEVDEGLDIVVTKTGATGEALKSLQESAKNLATTIPTSFADAGSAVGEVNTKFGLVGEDLEDLSGRFIKFAQLNSTDVSNAVDKTQKVMQAFGLETEEAGQLLDVMNGVGQATGISMDSLSSTMVKNAASLSEMGLSAYDAAQFLGAVEMSGANTETVMKGMQTALKNASKDGKTLPEVLSEFDEVMRSSATDQEKLNAAIELFGTKGGQQIYNACKNGSLDLKNFSEDATKYLGNVETTFESTQDAPDKMQVALNKVKEAGSTMGQTLLEIAAPKIEAFGEAVKDVGDWFQSLDTESQTAVGNVVAALAVGGPAVGIGGSLVSAAGKAAEAVGGIVTKIGGLTSAIPGLSTAASALAGAGGPLLVAGATVALAAGVVKSMTSDIEASSEDVKDLIKTQEENVKALDDAMKAVDEAMTSGNESIQAVNDQADMALGIVDELEKLEQQSSRTAQEEAHMQTLIGELNSMYPDLKVGIDKSTGSLNKSTKEIKNYIKNAKQMALLEAYTRASASAMDALVKANNELYNAEKGQAALKKAREEAELTRNALIGLQTQTGSTAYAGKIQDLANDINALDREIEDGQVTIDGYKEAVTAAENECASWGEQMEQVSASSEEATESTEGLTEAVEDHGNKSGEASKKINGLVSALGEEGSTALKARDDAVTAWEEMYTATKDSIDGQIKLFDEWQQDSEVTFEKVLANMKKNRKGITNYASNLQTLADAAVASGDTRFQAFVQYIADMGIEGAAYAQAMVDQLNTDKDEFNRIWKEYGKDTDAMDALAAVATYISSDFTTKTQAGAKAFNAAIDEIGGDTIMGKAVSRVKTNATNIANSLFGLADDAGEAGRKTGANLEAGYAGLEGTAKTAAEKASKASKEVIDNTEYDPKVDKVDVPESVTKAAQTNIETNLKPTIKVSSFSISDALTTARNAMQNFFNNNPIIAKLKSGGITGHAYGGFTDEEQLSWLSEGNKPEVVIPLSSSLRGRALDLFSQTGDILGVDTIPKERGSITMPVNPYTAPSELKFDTDKLYEAIAQGAAAGMESANVKIYWNDREAGRIMRDMGVQFA